MQKTKMAIAAFMLIVAAMLAVGCTKPDEPGNGGNGGNNGGNDEGVDTQTYTITATANPTNGGTVTGGGTYDEGESVTLRATANTNYTFDHWQDGNTANPRTITVTSNASYTAYFTYNNGHAYVDLGLPSGTLWATCNVGANAPEEYGDYFAWGETAPKTTYNWSTYKYCNGDYNQLTKYCRRSDLGYNGFTDNLTTLQLSDDAATVNWSIGWRTPTREQWRELYQNTTNIWTTQNGVNGRLFTAPNGQSLFLPNSGQRWDDMLCCDGSEVAYWSSSLNTVNPYLSEAFYFDWEGWPLSSSCSRALGQSVRPVRSSRQN